jgi:hypothetical protein
MALCEYAKKNGPPVPLTGGTMPAGRFAARTLEAYRARLHLCGKRLQFHLEGIQS